MEDIKKFEESIDDKLDRVMNEILEKEKQFRDKTMDELKKKKKHYTDSRLWEKLNSKRIREIFGEDGEKAFIKDERLDDVMDMCKDNMNKIIKD